MDIENIKEKLDTWGILLLLDCPEKIQIGKKVNNFYIKAS